MLYSSDTCFKRSLPFHNIVHVLGKTNYLTNNNLIDLCTQFYKYLSGTISVDPLVCSHFAVSKNVLFPITNMSGNTYGYSYINLKEPYTPKHTHTYIYIYIYIRSETHT